MTTAPSSPPDGPADGPEPTRSSLAKLVDLALVVPVEVSSLIVDVVPAVVDKVPAAAGRVRREVVLARFLGKMVVDQGVRELRARLTLHDDVPATGTVSVVATSPTTSPRPKPLEPGQDDDADGGIDAPAVSSLALADYDHLSSAQIVGKLDGLDATERQAIERYERAGRCRRTILGKLAQLEASA